MNKYIIGNGIITNGLDIFIPKGAILIEKGIIKNIGPLENIYKDKIKLIDVKGRLIIPGLLNAHTHFYSYFATGLSPKHSISNFKENLKYFWWPFDRVLDKESIYYSALLAAMESVEYGITTVFDHHASMNYVKGSLNLIQKACNKVGIKALLCFEVSERQGISEVKKQIEENLTFINENKRNKKINGAFGLHANFTLSDSTLKFIRDIKPQSVPIHIHCGEDIADLDFCLKRGYKGPVDRLNCFNLLSSNSILVHSIHLSKTDLRILKNKNPVVISAPESNANNNVGRIDVSKIKNYILGTDGMSCDMISTLRSHFLLQGGISTEILKNIFFKNKLRILEKYFPETGNFQIGDKADIAVLDYIPITPLNLDNLPAYLIFGAKNSKAFITIVNGKIVYFNGSFPNLNKEQIIKKAQKISQKLHKRYGNE